MDIKTYNKAMDILEKLGKKVDEAILQLEDLKSKEGIGFAKDDEDGYDFG